MNIQDLLKRYMWFVYEEEGTDFIERIDSVEEFTEEEKTLLKKLSDENGKMPY